MARAPHDARVREQLAAGFQRTWPAIATLFELGDDQAGHDAAGLALAQFYGLLLQVLLDPALAVDGKRLDRAQRRMLRQSVKFVPAALIRPSPQADQHQRGGHK